MSNGKAYNGAEKIPAGACGQETEVYSRVTGYFRPVSAWNKGKKEEFKERRTFEVNRKTLDKYYDPQMGVEIVTTEINGNAN